MHPTPSHPTHLVAVDPVDVLGEVHGVALVKVRHLGDRLGQQLGEGHPHLLLHQGEPLVDLGVLGDGDGRLVVDLLALAGADTEHFCAVLVQQDAGDACEHLLEVLLQLGHVLAVADDLQQVLVSHKVEPSGRE